MLSIAAILYRMTGDVLILSYGVLLISCALIWQYLLILLLGRRLSAFTSGLCRTLDNMMNGSEETEQISDSETFFAHISHRLVRLYGIMQENRRKVDEERRELQMLVSDNCSSTHFTAVLSR